MCHLYSFIVLGIGFFFFSDKAIPDDEGFDATFSRKMGQSTHFLSEENEKPWPKGTIHKAPRGTSKEDQDFIKNQEAHRKHFKDENDKHLKLIRIIRTCKEEALKFLQNGYLENPKQNFNNIVLTSKAIELIGVNNLDTWSTKMYNLILDNAENLSLYTYLVGTLNPHTHLATEDKSEIEALYSTIRVKNSEILKDENFNNLLKNFAF